MNQRKRLCIIYWNMGIGGIQKRIRDIINEISISYPEWDVYVLLRKQSVDGLDDQIKGKQRVTVRYYYPPVPFKLPLGFVYWIAWQYYTIKPDVVLTFQSLLSFVLMGCRHVFFWIHPKIVINEGAVTTQALAYAHISWSRFLVRLVYPYADAVIVPTHACKVDLVRNYSVPDEHISVIPNWTLFPPTSPRRPLIDILFIGRFDVEKNPLFMLQLTKMLVHMYRHQKIRVGMIGNGNLYQLLVDACRREKLQNYITIMPFSAHIEEVIRRSRLLVVPSFNEGMPNVVLEAGMSRVPAVVAHFLGAEEVIVQGKTGFIYNSRAEAVKYIDYLLTHASRRAVMGQRAQKYVLENFSYTTQKIFIDTVLGE